MDDLDRRQFLTLAASGLLALPGAGALASREQMPERPEGRTEHGRPDCKLVIGTGLVEAAPDRILSTTTYNGSFPGPLIRFKEGIKAVVDIHNDTDTPQQLHWHGFEIPVDIDGSAEEGTPYVPAHGMRRIEIVPKPAGLRFYHTHNAARGDLNAGQYTGLVGPVYVEPLHNAGGYDREVFLVLKEFAPSLSRGGDMAMDFLSPSTTSPDLVKRAAQNDARAKGKPKGFEVGYDVFTINGYMLGHGEPIRVRRGERVLFHIVNGSAGEIRSLALPGHTFRLVALDGNPVARPTSVPVLYLGTAERVSAIVHMEHPGVWVMGDLMDDDRHRGMGIVVEYAGSTGKPRWAKPAKARWDYSRFGDSHPHPGPVDETFTLLFEKQQAAENGFNRWTINGQAFSMGEMRMPAPMLRLRKGGRYRLRLRNASDDIHPVHLHRHTFELTKFAGKRTSGVYKDVVMVGGFQEVEIDFTADAPGLSLFHCHQQLHMDFGFMALFETR